MQNKIPSLEFIRGVACIVVLLSHIRVASTYYSDPAYDFIQTFTSWGKEAVIVFFLLSGIVINIATQNQINRKEYFKKRFFRIYPIYFFTIILTISIGYLISAKLPDFSTLIGNVFLLGTMEGHLLPTIPYNAVVWSISCEMFFYMVYGFLFTKNRIINIWTWLIISIISILFKLFFKNPEIETINYLIYMLNMSFIWLLGYILYEYRT